MSPVNIVLAGLLGLVTVAWALAPDSGASASGALPWIVRQQTLYLSGLYSVALMSLAVMLSTRPVWLERPLGGLDRVYRLHKWSGILAVTFAAVHWLIEMSDDLLKAWIGRAGRVGAPHRRRIAELLSLAHGQRLAVLCHPCASSRELRVTIQPVADPAGSVGSGLTHDVRSMRWLGGAGAPTRAQQSNTDQQRSFRNRWSSRTSARIVAGSWSRCQRHSSRPALSPSPAGAAARAALIA